MVAQTATRLQVIPGGVARQKAVGGFDGPPPRVAPPIANAQLAVLMFIACETMVFVGLITAYWVLRSGSFTWPPPHLPHLPLAITWVNTGMLLFSAVTMRRASVAIRDGDTQGLRTGLVATAVLGTGFLAVQGTEWVRLLKQGLTLQSGAYGATFYSLIGLHALHVVGAVIWLLAVLVIAQRGGYSAKQRLGIDLCASYWYFVCALWIVLFGSVYLY